MTRESKEKLERYKQCDKIGWDMLNRYMDHLDNCETCAEHYGISE